MRGFHLLPVLSLCFAAGIPASAEEILMKDGTKIIGHMTSLKSDKIEVETNYGKMELKRADILSINFPENGAPASSSPATAPSAPKEAVLNIDESLHGTQHVNNTAKFTLTVPADWKINETKHSAPIVAALSSRDDMRYLAVTQEEYTGSLESYKGLLELTYRRTFGSYESPIKIDGKPGLLFSFRGISTKANNLPMQFLVAVIPSGTSYTRIATWCVEPLFHETQPTFEKILASYHSNRTPAVSAGNLKP